EMGAYEELLFDAMRGNSARFARRDYVEEAWRIVDPVVHGDLPVYEYEPGTWGPSQANGQIAPDGGGFDPTTGPYPRDHGHSEYLSTPLGSHARRPRRSDHRRAGAGELLGAPAVPAGRDLGHDDRGFHVAHLARRAGAALGQAQPCGLRHDRGDAPDHRRAAG